MASMQTALNRYVCLLQANTSEVSHIFQCAYDALFWSSLFSSLYKVKVMVFHILVVTFLSALSLSIRMQSCYLTIGLWFASVRQVMDAGRRLLSTREAWECSVIGMIVKLVLCKINFQEITYSWYDFIECCLFPLLISLEFEALWGHLARSSSWSFTQSKPCLPRPVRYNFQFPRLRAQKAKRASIFVSTCGPSTYAVQHCGGIQFSS